MSELALRCFALQRAMGIAGRFAGGVQHEATDLLEIADALLDWMAPDPEARRLALKISMDHAAGRVADLSAEAIFKNAEVFLPWLQAGHGTVDAVCSSTSRTEGGLSVGSP